MNLSPWAIAYSRQSTVKETLQTIHNPGMPFSSTTASIAAATHSMSLIPYFFCRAKGKMAANKR